MLREKETKLHVSPFVSLPLPGLHSLISNTAINIINLLRHDLKALFFKAIRSL